MYINLYDDDYSSQLVLKRVQKQMWAITIFGDNWSNVATSCAAIGEMVGSVSL